MTAHQPLAEVRLDADGTLSEVGAGAALWPWWSVTKTVMAAGVLRLAAQGRVHLDACPNGAAFTFRQLLRHRAGVRDYGGLAAYHAAVARGDPPWSRGRLLHEVEAARPAFAPDTGWAYSNVGYLFVRELIERRTGLDLEAALRTLVIEPLRLASPRLARPADFAQLAPGYDPGWVFHGCLVGTPVDAARLMRALLDGTLLERDAREAMAQRHRLGGAVPGRPWTDHGYGLGLMIGEMGGIGRAVGHSGGGPGSTAAVYHFPDAPRAPTVAVFRSLEDESHAEFAAARLAAGP